jgi:hypothetical protein
VSAEAAPAPSSLDIVRMALAAAGVLVFFTNADNYGFDYLRGPKPVLLVVLFMAAAGALAVIRPNEPLMALRSPVLAWVLFFFFLTTIWALWMRSGLGVLQVVHDRYRSVAFLAAFLLLFDSPRARHAAAVAIAVVIVCAAALNVAELMGAVSFPKGDEDLRVAGRSAGLYVNPNGSGFAIVFGLAVALRSLAPRWRGLLLVAGAVGVLTTFSRGALLCFGLLVLLLVLRREVPIWPLAASALAAGTFFAMQTDSALTSLHSMRLVNESTLLRLQFAHDDSGRLELAEKALRMFLESPLVGKGLGSTVDWADLDTSSHNQFLNLAGDHGILGLLAFPALGLALVRRNPAAVPFVIVLMAAGLFSHNLLDDRVSLLPIALAAAGMTPAPAEGEGSGGEVLPYPEDAAERSSV